MASEEIKQASPRRARNSLSRELILDASLELAQSGAEISLRSVAARLECSAMALYRHFPDKQELLLGLLDRVIGSIGLENATQPWHERLLKLAKQHLRVLQGNPWAIPLLFQYPDPGPAVRNVGEAMLAALKEGGASDASAVNIFAAILALNYGWAGFTADRAPSNEPSQISTKLSAAPSPNEGLSVTTQMWPHFESLGSDRGYEFAIRKLIIIGEEPPTPR